MRTGSIRIEVSRFDGAELAARCIPVFPRQEGTNLENARLETYFYGE